MVSRIEPIWQNQTKPNRVETWMKRARGHLAEIAFQLVDGAPLHQQIYQRLRTAALEGRLPAGARLPSTRTLAEMHCVSRTTVLAAYAQLLAEGYVEGRSGAGTRISNRLPEALLQAGAGLSCATRAATNTHATPVRQISRRSEALRANRFGPEWRLPRAEPGTAFRLALPALDHFPAEIWSRIAARHARRVGRDYLDYQDGRGAAPLRRAIATHLAVARGVRCLPEQIIVTAGAQSAIDLCIRVLLDPEDRALIEDPCHLGIQAALRSSGITTTTATVDSEGMVVPDTADARLAFVTPSNQFPLAVTMSLPRRLALLDWARRADAWIVEDDYDSEFRHEGRPIEALQGLDRAGRVIYVGSFSKILFPGLRLGYLVVPPDLADAFIASRRFIDVHPPALQQNALAEFIEEGHFGRHLRRMRMLYAERGQALMSAHRRHLDGLANIAQPQAGMHAVAWLTKASDDVAAYGAVARLGVETRPLSLYGKAAGPPALVLGFGSVTPEAIERGAQDLARGLSGPRAAQAPPPA